MQDEQLVAVLSRWKTARDRITSGSGRSPLDISSPQSEFLRAIGEACKQLETVLPVMNMAELEALSELSASLLADRRMKDQQARGMFIRP